MSSPEVKPEIRLEIGHVLFIDIIGYSKLLITEQTEQSARRAFTTARAAQEKVVEKQKDYAPALCLVGLIDAALGNKQAALEEGRRATELLPVSKDALDGPVMSAYFAIIAAWTGEKDLAIRAVDRPRSTRSLRPSLHPLRIPQADALLGPAPRRSALRKNR